MKRVLILVAMIAMASFAMAQGGNTLTIRFAGVPSGTCAPFFLGVNNATSDLYNCTSGGAWNLVSGAAGGTAWDAITNPVGNLALSMGINTSIFSGTAATSQFFAWKNTTAAVVGTSQGSPVLALCGRAFHGSADVEDCMTYSELPGNGNDAAITQTFGHTGTSTGALTTSFPGSITAANGNITATGGVFKTTLIGSAGGPVFATDQTGTGIYRPSTQSLSFAVASTEQMRIANSSGATGGAALSLLQASQLLFGATTYGTQDVGVSREAAGILDFGGVTANTTTAKLKASGYMSVGTKFTTNNGCTDSATAGGATAGTFTVGSTSCTEVVTMGDSATAPNGWSCTVVDITTLADVTNPHQTTSNATTATFVTGTVVSGDKIQFSCIGY